MSQFVKEIAFMLILSTCCALLIGVANLTSKNGSQISLSAVKLILDVTSADTKKDDAILLKIFESDFKKLSINGSKTIVWQRKVMPEFMAIEKTGSGMWGKIKVLVLFNAEKSQIKAVRILKQNETPGLGSRITEADFYEQFSEMQANKVKLISNPAEPGEFDGISGATISSKSVEKIINSAIKNIEVAYRQDKKAIGESDKGGQAL